MKGEKTRSIALGRRGLAAWACAATVLVTIYLLIGRLEPLGSPRAFHGRLAATILTGLLVIYPVAAIGAILGLGFFTRVVVVRSKRSGRLAPAWALRAMLACGSMVLAILVAEAAASACLGFRHRMPSFPARFPEKLPGDPIELVVIGGSSALGAPYEDWLSVGAIVGRELERAIPGGRFHVSVLAEKGASLERMHHKLAALERRPDALIVYSGHNEFLARFTLENQTVYYDDERPAARAWAMLDRLGRVSAVFRLTRENLEKERVGLLPSQALGTVERTIGRPSASAAETQAVLADFAARLEAITALCERIGCLPILVVPPGNDYADPNHSYADPRTLHHQRQALFDRLVEARRREADSPADAIAAYRAILADQPRFAVAHHRLARLLDDSGQFALANRHYIMARDCDGLPLRCISAIEEAYHAVARRHAASAILIDGPAILRAASKRGVIDRALVHDLVHPTLAGYGLLAQAVLTELKMHKAWGWPESTPAPTIEPSQLESEFRLDSSAWATICKRVAAQYEMIEFLTVDPGERIAWRDRFLEAAKRLSAGARPPRLGLPGVGAREPFSKTSPESTNGP